MSNNAIVDNQRCFVTKGFTLMELIVAIAIMAIVMAIAIPSFVSWRENMQYRQAGRELVTFIRTARSSAISTNRQQRIEINIANRSYHLRPGERAANSGWALAAGADVLMPSSRTGIASIGIINNTRVYDLIVCNPNGTMQFTGNTAPPAETAVVITIFDNQTALIASQNSQRYRIDLTQTGRIAGKPVSPSDAYP